MKPKLKLARKRAERRAAERELRELLRKDADPSLAAELETLIRDALAYVPSPWPLPGSEEEKRLEAKGEAWTAALWDFSEED